MLSRRSGRIALSLLAVMVAAAAAAAPSTAAPPNDDFADARVVGPALPVSVAGTNVDGTVEEGEPMHYSGNQPQSSVWYRWTAPSSAKVTVSVCEPDLFYGQMAVYTGNTLGGLTKVIEDECIGRFNAVEGTTYSIAIEGYDSPQPFTFVLRPFSPPANDSFATPQVVGPELPIAQPATNVDSTGEAGDNHGGHTVWFIWTAPDSTRVRLDTCDFDPVSGPGNQGIWVYTGNTLATLVDVAEDFDGCRLSFDVIEGTTYRIVFSTGNLDGEGPFTLRLLEETPPANDNFASAQAVGPALPVAVSGSTVFSTVETDEPHHGNDDESSFAPNDTVWFAWTSQTSTQVRVRVCADDGFGARLGIYTGNAVNALTRVTPAVPLNSFPFCALRFNAVAGTIYRIAVGGRGSEDEGDFLLDIHVFSPPANDLFASAQPIGPQLPVSVQGTNVDAGVELGEPDHSQYDESPPNASVWYSWTPPATGVARLSTCGTGFASLLSVYTGSAVDELTKLAAGKGGCGSTGGQRLDFAALAGVRYLIAFDGAFDDEEGPFTLSIVDPSAVPPPPLAAPVPVSDPPVAKRGKKFSLRKALRRCRKIKRRKPRRRCVRKARRTAKRLQRQGRL